MLAFIGRGYSIPQIAEKLYRSQKTIETHRQSLGRKLGVSNRVELARIAIQAGLAPLDPAEGGLDMPIPRGGEDEAADLHQILVGDPVASDAMARIESACWPTVGRAFCRTLVQGLVDALAVSGAGVITFDEQITLYRAVAILHRDDWTPEFQRPLNEGPCRQVIRDGFFACTRDVERRFVGWRLPDLPAIKSYMGIRLDGPMGDASLGILLLLQDEPVSFDRISESVLRVCAIRVAAELGRMRLIDSLQASVESLEQQLTDREDVRDTGRDGR